jgi:hypothetical protein
MGPFGCRIRRLIKGRRGDFCGNGKPQKHPGDGLPIVRSLTCKRPIGEQPHVGVLPSYCFVYRDSE